MSDPLREAMRRADHWAQLGWAEAWAAVARLLEPAHPRAARTAWRHAADGYDAYRAEYDAHMPASRWDYDYGPEQSDARARASDRAPIDRADAALPDWIDAALEGRLTEAIDRAPAPAPAESNDADDLSRAVLRALDVARHTAPAR